jgi:hypothetical protein
MQLCRFHGTFKCVTMQFVSGAPLARFDDCCRAQLCIGALILTLFLMVLTCKHLGVFGQILLEVQICASCMKIRKSKNVLDLDNVRVHRILALHLNNKFIKFSKINPI